MTISRMQMERQLRAGGGLMTLEEPRQGYFLGKIVKKAKRAVKKVVKSPIGKIALLGGLGAYAGGLGPFANLKGAGFLRGAGSGILSGLKGGEGFLGQIGNVFRVGGEKANPFSALRLLGGGLGAAAIAAPFFMGGDEEEVEEETPFTETPSSIANIVEQARNQDPSLRFLPQPKFVRNFYAADGGLATMRENFDEGKMALGEGFKSKELNDMALDMFGKNLRLLSRDELELLRDEYNIKKGMTEVEAKDGGLMDLGGMEKDYREGGFVPLGAEERADDVPARLSKNEFVFTADAVRNAGGGDIDKGAEVMQNMMDNLEAGGMISEESQGMNPAQEMFDQSQMLEGRLA
jgi:hypothetical protein